MVDKGLCILKRIHVSLRTFWHRILLIISIVVFDLKDSDCITTLRWLLNIRLVFKFILFYLSIIYVYTFIIIIILKRRCPHPYIFMISHALIFHKYQYKTMTVLVKILSSTFNVKNTTLLFRKYLLKNYSIRKCKCS